MCRKPLRIKNNSKYIAQGVGHQYYIWVNCGKCDECRRNKQLEWNLRTYYQCKDVLSQGGYIYFDTLTYRNVDLPRITNYIEANQNYACFNYLDIRYFYETLRQLLQLRSDKVKYFITSEYGDIRHRPHYHLMLFVYDNNIEPFELSKAVTKAWKYGRTDGLPYKSKLYVTQHNIIKEMNIDAIRYIAKYVNKSQSFMKIINVRWQKLERWYEKSKFNKLQIKKIRKQYYRLTTPFHRQSQGFGIKAIENIDIKELMENPILWYRDNTLAITRKVRLPMYYYRKLFAQQIKYRGKRIWVNNENGINYKLHQEEKLLERVVDKIKDQAVNNNVTLDENTINDLATYILFERGRLAGKQDYKPHHEEAEIFNYNTDKDLLFLGKKCVSLEYAGNDKIGYCTTAIEATEIENNVYIRNDLETILERLQQERDTTSLNILLEHMNEIKKIFFQK